jgi:tetratricopeptide (TPR) repeat protein
MNKNFNIFIAAIACFMVICSCKPNYEKDLLYLEQAFSAHRTDALTDSLLQTYYKATAALDTSDALRLRYLTRSAEIQFLNKQNGNNAVRNLHRALQTQGKHDLMAPVALLTRVFNAYKYKAQPTVGMYPEEIDQMKADLVQHRAWIDSALVRLDRTMMKTPNAMPDAGQAEDFLDISEGYASLLIEQDPAKAGNLLLKAAALAKSIENPNRALRLYYKLTELLPQHPKAPTALFMMGFIQENDLNQLDDAKTLYEAFLKRYPNDPDYADDAQNALKMLGKSPEELIKMFEAQAK